MPPQNSGAFIQFSMHVDGDANLYRATTLDMPSKYLTAILTLVDHNIYSQIIEAEK